MLRPWIIVRARVIDNSRKTVGTECLYAAGLDSGIAKLCGRFSTALLTRISTSHVGDFARGFPPSCPLLLKVT